MIIGFSFFYSWPKGFGESSVWFDINFIGVFIFLAPLIYIIRDLIRVVRKIVSQKKK